jgi:ubiquinol-cytochrome c reductase iron-sulfur subunit
MDCGEVMTSTHREPAQFDVDDPSLARFDLIREGTRRDGVAIVHYAPRFPVPRSKAEKRVERTIALLLTLSGLAAAGFVVIFIAWPWRYQAGTNASKYYTPMLGLSLGLALTFIGFAVMTWSKKLLPEEIAVQDRHDIGDRTERQLTGAALGNMMDEVGIQRRPLIKAALLLPAGALGVAAAVPLGALIKSPHTPGPILFQTGWDPANNNGQKVRLVRDDGTPIRPEDVSVGGQMTVFPGIPDGTTNKWADSPTLLIHLREEDAEVARQSAARSNHGLNAGSQWGSFLAYSKICTHAGCPASLYEQQTNRLLCPCHQSQFNIIDNARPIFGPASRSLPQLPIEVDAEGYFVARSDYKMAVGPAFWERP